MLRLFRRCAGAIKPASVTLEQRPRRHSGACSNPTCHGSRGQGARNNTGPLAAGGTSMRNRGTQRTSPLGTGVEDSSLALDPSGLVRGHPARCPRLDTISFRYLSTARPPAGRVEPLASPTRGEPLDPGSFGPCMGTLVSSSPAESPAGTPEQTPSRHASTTSPDASRSQPASSNPSGRAGNNPHTATPH